MIIILLPTLAFAFGIPNGTSSEDNSSYSERYLDPQIDFQEMNFLDCRGSGCQVPTNGSIGGDP
ncbi:MAG: hypothetical protein HeimC3_12970 [Candidatus Heimdallarchaeota archaeon LC_3]|nr:MAG: hypothetical protein HeimC3_15980 [Candidatus Heimdallarchaeota archaeon LC_3]OLS26023.1 MAG: hypothetical protein HeimC3_12970 [Candidatus Heimdallarchaeota archaeon LC_3]